MSSRDQYKQYVIELKAKVKRLEATNEELITLSNRYISIIKQQKRKLGYQKEKIIRLCKTINKVKRWYQIIIKI